MSLTDLASKRGFGGWSSRWGDGVTRWRAPQDQVASTDEQLEKNSSKPSVSSIDIEDAPRAPPLRLTTYVQLVCIVTVLAFLPVLGYILGFSAIGYGEYAFKGAKAREDSAKTLLVIALVYWLISWVIDAALWTHPTAVRVRDTMSTLVLGAFTVGVLLSAGSYSFGPFCVFMVLYPAYLFALWYMPCICRRANTRQYLGVLPVPLVLVSLFTFIVWIVWIAANSDNEWNTETRKRLAENVECEVTDDDSADDPSYESCLDAFLLWVTPMAMSVCTGLYALFALFLDEDKEHRAPKAFKSMVMFLLGGMWIAASLSGAGPSITSAFFAVVLAGLVALGGMLVFAFGTENLAYRAERSEFALSLKQKYSDNQEWFQGLFVLACGPLVIVYLGLAILNQAVRRCGNCGAKKLEDEEEKQMWVTLEARERMRTVQSWHWASVLSKAMVWGIIFMAVNVIVGKLIIVFLSWLIEFAGNVQGDAPNDALGILYVTGLIFFVGLILFGLPCVPGAPIYLTGGIILVAAAGGVADDDEGADMGVPLCIVYTCVIGLLLKLAACTIQQCLIGAPLKKSLYIRQAIGINSPLIRSMKLVLQRPGLDIPKVAILVGGPDWPTSVLCGILGLPLGPILLGTTPVVSLVIPTTMSGSFLYLGSLDKDMYSWAGTASTITAVASAGVQICSMLTAAYYIEKVGEEYKEELEAMPYDEEVRQADAIADAKKLRLEELRQWEKFDRVKKGVLVYGTVCMSACIYIVQMFGQYCFEDFELTDTIDEELDGKVTNFIMPLGNCAMILFFMALGSYFGYDWLMQQELKRSLLADPLPAPQFDQDPGSSTNAEKSPLADATTA